MLEHECDGADAGNGDRSLRSIGGSQWATLPQDINFCDDCVSLHWGMGGTFAMNGCVVVGVPGDVVTLQFRREYGLADSQNETSI